MGGTELHADIGAVSLNLWVTPDSANLDAEGGGLEILPLALRPDWAFHRMNAERDALHRFAAEAGVAPVRIAHCCNRMVVFGARLLHRTDVRAWMHPGQRPYQPTEGNRGRNPRVDG
jgi:hypothetical protein